MKPCILSDEAAYSIKKALQTEMANGLVGANEFESLPMRITYVMDRFKGTETGSFISICAHAHHFTITLVKLKSYVSPEIHRKDYHIDPAIFKEPYIKIYDTFAEYVKKFFIDFNLDGEIIPASFCTNLHMEQYSLDTAVIPHFTPDSKMHHSQRDIKASFEHVLQKDKYQDQADLIKSSKSDNFSNITASSDTERFYHAVFDAKLLGSDIVKGLESTPDGCHNLLLKFQNIALEIGEPIQTILLDVSHAGIKVQDKVFKNSLYHHPIHKISQIVMDFKNSQLFGYLYGDFLYGHQFYGFKIDRSAVEIVSLLRNIFAVELIRKKKEKLDIQASQVFMTLKNFLSLGHELKAREIQIPLLLQKRFNMVKNINWWIEGSFDDPAPVFEESEEMLITVHLQDLYAAACHLKQIKIQKEEAAKIEQERLSGKPRRRRKIIAEDKSEDLPKKDEAHDPLLLKVADIFAENVKFFESILESSETQLALVKEKLKNAKDNFDDEDFKSARNFFFSIFNLWREEKFALGKQIQSMIEKEYFEREKINYKVSPIYTGQKQILKITKKLVKNSIFEDTDFAVMKKRKTNSDLLNKVLSCEEYYLYSLKMRREEIQDLNYFISELHFRESIFEPEDTKVVDFCRRLFVKAGKMRLKEIQDIENKLNILKNVKEKVIHMVPDIIKSALDHFRFIQDKRKSSIHIIETLLSNLPVSLKVTEENVNLYRDIFTQYLNLTEDYIEAIKVQIKKIHEKESSVENATNICYQLFSQTIKMRKNEFDTTVSDLSMFDTVDVDINAHEDKNLLHFCLEEYLTAACMREKEIEYVDLQIKTTDKIFTDGRVIDEDSRVGITLKDLFYAAVEMETFECEQFLKQEIVPSEDSKVLPVVYNFKDLVECVAEYLKKKKPDTSSLKEPQIFTSLREYLMTTFEMKQQEIEIPISDLKKDLENVLLGLIEDVKKRQHERQQKQELHEEALKVSRAWKEVFLLSVGVRKKEMEELISLSRKAIIEEEAILKSQNEDNFENTDNMANQVLNSWKKIFSLVMDIKDAEMGRINAILKQIPGGQKDYLPKLTAESTNIDDDDERYYESDDGDTIGKKESPSEEILKAITSCKNIYNIAIEKGSAQLKEMEYEMRPIFSVEYDEEKTDVMDDEVTLVISKSSSIITKYVENIKEDVFSMKSDLESLTKIEENIKSQVATAKSTSIHFLTVCLELEENAFKTTEDKINELDKAFEKILSEESVKFRPFTDLAVDVFSDEELAVTEVEQDSEKKDETEPQDYVHSKLTKEGIQSFLFEVDAELQPESDQEQVAQRKEVMNIYESCKSHLELASEMRRDSINSIIIEIEKLKLPDPKKLKAKEKMKRALKSIVSCKETFMKSINFRFSEIKSFQSDIERMKATQRQEQIVIEYEPSDIVGSCRKLFLSAVETRGKNIIMMQNEIESLEEKKFNLSDDIKPEARVLMKSEIYVTCKDLVLECVDLKMKEIDDISTQIEVLNNIELKIEIQLKQLNPEKHRNACTKLEKAKDAVATCKKLCITATERSKKEVRDTDEELELLKGALEISETSLITATCKNLLMLAIEKRELEISEIELESDELKEKVQNLLTELAPLNSSETSLVTEENTNTDEKISEREIQSAVEPLFNSSTKNVELKESLGQYIDIEGKAKKNLEMVTLFLQECKETLDANILKKKEEISNLESDLDKIKVTVQKVEAEDSQVFSLCQKVFIPIVEMRREEIKSFESELKVLERLIEERLTAPVVQQKTQDNPEESEVVLAIASSKRVLNLAIKNRKSEKDNVNFELMKLVRFQDSRIINVCKQFLYSTLHKSSEEMETIKTMLLKIEGMPVENENETLVVSEKVLQSLCQVSKLQIDAFNSDLQDLAKKKMQMEIEESQFVLTCKSHFSSQVVARQKEITVMLQECDTLAEQSHLDGALDVKVFNLKSVYEKMYENDISTRKKEIETFELELIKHIEIKVSEEISVYKSRLQTAIVNFKQEFKMYEEAVDVLDILNNEKFEILPAVHKLQKLYSSTLKKRRKDCKESEKMLMLLQGKKIVTDKEEMLDERGPLKQEACFEKLKTDASVVISSCKEILYSIIDVANTEIQDINLAMEELKRQDDEEKLPKKKQIVTIHDENSRYTEKELALLEALEQDILNSKSAKNLQVTEFCDQFLTQSIYSCDAIIQEAKHFLEKLSNIEEGLIFEASKLVQFMTSLMKSIYDEQVSEIKDIQNSLNTLNAIKTKDELEKEDIVSTFQEMLSATSEFKKETVAFLKLSLDSFLNKEECLRNEASKVCKSCGVLLNKIMEVIEIDMKHIFEDLDSLKQFRFPDNEEESKLSEDEKAVKKCKLFMVAAINNRKNLGHSINLELKYLKGATKKIGTKDARSFPSWYDRFLTFLDVQDEHVTVGTSNLSPTPFAMSDTLIKPQISAAYHQTKSDNSDHFQKLEYYTDLLASLEQKRTKQPAHISSWDNLFLRSFLKNQILKYSPEHNDATNGTQKQMKSWEVLFIEADQLMKKQEKEATSVHKEKRSKFMVSPWINVLMQAVKEWDVIVEEESHQLKQENLLLQWKGKMKSKENLRYSSAYKYGYQPKEFNKIVKQLEKRDEGIEEMSAADGSSFNFRAMFASESADMKNQTSPKDGTVDYKLNEGLSSWTDIFSKSADLIEDDHKAFNAMQKKDMKLQSQVIKISSSWDDLFIKAIEQGKVYFQDKIKENDVLKDLAKVVNEEIQGTVTEPRSVQKIHKYDSWLQLIYDISELHKKDLLDALSIKKSEMEKSSRKTAEFEIESADSAFLNLETRKLLDEGKALLSDALDIRKTELNQMGSNLISVEVLTNDGKFDLQKLQDSIYLWKVIVLLALDVKASGQKVEPGVKKHFNKSSKDLFTAAMQSKLKETENYESYWKKFSEEKRSLIQISPADLSWCAILNIISELANKDIAKMSILGIRVEPDEKLEHGMKAADTDINAEALEDSACWMDLVLDALAAEDNESDSKNTISEAPAKESLMSWDEIFYFMNQMTETAIQENIFAPKEIVDYSKLKDIQNMVSSNFFSWDILIVKVIEEIILLIRNMSENPYDMISPDSEDSYNDDKQNSISFQNVLKMHEMKSFLEILPSMAGAERVVLEDNLNETRKKIWFPEISSQTKEINEKTIWKFLFPIAVEVWSKKMKNYLNFDLRNIKKNVSLEKQTSRSKSQESVSFNLDYQDNDVNSVENLEKVLAYEYISDVEGSNLENFPQFNELEEQSPFKNFSPFMIDEMKKNFNRGENMNPQYFDVPATWHQMLKAALQRYKQFLNGVIDLNETEEEALEIIPSAPFANVTANGRKKLKFNASNVLNQEITLYDLFEVVDILKKNNLILLKEVKRKDEMVNDIPVTTMENLEVNKVIESFTETFVTAYKTRYFEKNSLETEVGKLVIVTLNNCQKYRSYPVLSKLLNYFNAAIKTRSKENNTINFELENLNDFKCIFAGYLECPVTESLLKRNDRRVKELDSSLHKIESEQKTLMKKLQNRFNLLVSTLDSYLIRRKTKAELVKLEQVYEIIKNLEIEHRETFINSKKIFSTVTKFRKKEISSMQKFLMEWNKLYKPNESIEDTIHIIISTILNFFEDEMRERRNIISSFLYEKDLLKEKKTTLRTKISSIYANCSNYLQSAFDNRKTEILDINTGLSTIMDFSKQPNKPTMEVMKDFKEICNKFIRMREKEMQLLEAHIVNVREAKISEVQSACLEYFSQAITSRKFELDIIEEQIESLLTLDASVEIELSDAIEEAFADVIDLSPGVTFLHALSEKKDLLRDKVNSEVLKKCSEFYTKRKEDMQVEIKKMEESFELLKFFKGDAVLMIINAIEEFEKLFGDGLQAIEVDSKNILSEQMFVENCQSSFYSEIFGYLDFCKKQLEENLSEINRDIYILQLQLGILSEEYKDIFDKNILDTSIYDTPEGYDCTEQDIAKDASPSMPEEVSDTIYLEDSLLVKNCSGILDSALEFRSNYIDILTSEIKSLKDVERKAFEILSECTNHLSNMTLKRKNEKQSINDNLLPEETASKTDVMRICTDCLNCLLLYNTECLIAIAPDFDRLTVTVQSIEKQRSAVFSYCEKYVQNSIIFMTREMENINSEIITMDCMQSKKDAEYVASSKSIFEKGVEVRNSEIIFMRNILEELKSETEILPILNMCQKHFQTSIWNRGEEIICVEKQIEILENEAPMLLLVHAPALESVVEKNKEILEYLKPFVKKLDKISEESKSEEEKIIHSCHKLYCNMLETLKIEREAIKYDIDSLRPVELESRDIIDTEGKEVVISFKDLFFTAFDVKRSSLEKNILKKNVEESINSKWTEVIQSLQKEKTSDIDTENMDISEKRSNSHVKNVEEIQKPHEESEKTFKEFVQYYDIKKEKRRSMIEHKIMDEFEAIEKTIDINSSESLQIMAEFETIENILSRSSSEDIDIPSPCEENTEEEKRTSMISSKPKNEESFKRMYEIRMKAVEKDIAHKHEKITGVINARKSLMDDIVTSKKKELEGNIAMKEREMRNSIDSIRGTESNIVCSLKDIFSEIIHSKNNTSDLYLLQNAEKFVAKEFQSFHVSVKLEKFMDIILEVKELELQMMLLAKNKDLEKIIYLMKREIEKSIIKSKEELEEEIKLYRKAEKAKAMEYATSGSTTLSEDYLIQEEVVFPNITSFKKYVNSLKGFFVPKSKKAYVYKDATFRSEEILKSNSDTIPLFGKHLPLTYCVPNHVLKLLEVEIKSILKILSEMNLVKAKAILHGLSFKSAETIAHEISSKRVQREILLNIVSVLNDNTSMLVLGSFRDQNCDVSFNLDKDCSLVYFEKTENIKKWSPNLENVNEVAVNVGLKEFGRNGCLDEIATKFDWAVTTVPIGPSIFERFISDIGLLEQMKFAFLELHHHHLFCRYCDFTNLLQDFGLTFDHVSQILNSTDVSNSSKLLPLKNGTPSADDVTIANYVCRIILLRGALLSAICLSTVLEKNQKKEITVITTSFFIQEFDVYRKILKIFLSYLNPGKQVNFIYCKKSDCGIGASIMASVASQISSETPGLYLLELEQRLKNRNKLFSIQSFFKLLSNPELSEKAEQLAQRYMKEMKFDLPLAVIWAYKLINGKIEEAENIYKHYTISFAKVSNLVCRKISSSKDLDLAQAYMEFLKKYGAEQRVKESAYKVLFDMLFFKDMYQEAVDLILECMDNKIPVSKLRHSTLIILHDFCVRESSKTGGVPSFPMPVKAVDSSTSDSDTEERIGV